MLFLKESLKTKWPSFTPFIRFWGYPTSFWRVIHVLSTFVKVWKLLFQFLAEIGLFQVHISLWRQTQKNSTYFVTLTSDSKEFSIFLSIGSLRSIKINVRGHSDFQIFYTHPEHFFGRKMSQAINVHPWPESGSWCPFFWNQRRYVLRRWQQDTYYDLSRAFSTIWHHGYVFFSQLKIYSSICL